MVKFLTALKSCMTAGVRIKTPNRDALNAIHDVLIFQIKDHHTGDKTD